MRQKDLNNIIDALLEAESLIPPEHSQKKALRRNASAQKAVQKDLARLKKNQQKRKENSDKSTIYEHRQGNKSNKDRDRADTGLAQ